MSERATQLQQAAGGQISELITLLSAHGETALSLPCPGREKMGDGTVAACASHTAERYVLIARFLRARAHAPGEEGERLHGGDYKANNVDFERLLKRLSAGSDALGLLADLTDEQLDTVPPAGSFRFCDGQRTLEQVIASLLKHQSHQIDALTAALRGSHDCDRSSRRACIGA